MRRLAPGVAVVATLLIAACAASGPAAPAPPTDLAAAFAYEASAPLDLRTDAAAPVAGGTVVPISYASPKAGRASGFLALPSGPGPFAAVVLVPGSNAAPSAMRPTALELLGRGIAAIAIDQTQTRAGHRPLFTFTAADRDEAVGTVIDLRRAIDLLLARQDIDPTRLGYWGVSHGAFLGGILSGIDRRVRAYVLQSGGGADYLVQNAPKNISDPSALSAYLAAIASVDPNTFVSRAAPAALLLQNGTRDRTYSEAGVAAWTAAASEPKQIRSYPSDHLLDTDATADAMSFLVAALAPTATKRSPLEDARGVIAEQRLARLVARSYYVSLVATDSTPIAVSDPSTEPGFELVVSGSEHLSVDGRASDIASGHAAAIGPAAKRERSSSDGAATSYFVSLRPADQRERYLPPHAQILYESADLPASAVPAGGYDDVLVMLVLAPGQVVPPHMHGGIEPTYVIEGTIELRMRGQPIRLLAAGDGDTVLPDTPLLITNVGPSIARVLVMLATPDGKPVQTQTNAP